MRCWFVFALIAAGCVGSDGTDHDPSSNTDHDMSDDGMDTDDIDVATEGMTQDGTYHVSYTSDPDPVPLAADFSVIVTVTDGTDPVMDATVSVDATMPAHGHGMNTNPSTVSNGDGTYAATGLLFHMEGWWEIAVTIDSAEGSDQAYLNVLCCD